LHYFTKFRLGGKVPELLALVVQWIEQETSKLLM
jgi:hypothetical protein